MGANLSGRGDAFEMGDFLLRPHLLSPSTNVFDSLVYGTLPEPAAGPPAMGAVAPTRAPRSPARAAAALAAAALAMALLTGSCSSGGGSAAPPSIAGGTGHTTPSISPSTPHVSPTPAAQAVPRPPIVQHPIPFPETRKDETRAYAEEHYGLDTFNLIDPRVIVEHFTASETFPPVFNTFAADTPHLGELPGTCSHFVIDKDGTIYQLVPLDLMCRHTVGLNWTAIGIEMVGESDREILDDPDQLKAALDLTLWLMQRFHVQLRNVIGHNESLTSPFHMERVPSLKCQTHQDWNRQDMEIFRADLAGLARMFRVPLGPPAQPVNSGC
jgi:N-acetylmuramoyl-L-alanine amidase